ncbi:MAG: hypothetical protein WCX31_22475 [Salinivirgaceae bacterium]
MDGSQNTTHGFSHAWSSTSKFTLASNKVIFEKINYIHNNPVEEGLVYCPDDYVYSSAKDYSDQHGVLNNVIVID